jgi:hypothetical protein
VLNNINHNKKETHMTTELFVIIATILNKLKGGSQGMNVFAPAPLARAIMKKWPENTYHLEFAAPETCQAALLPYGVKFYKILHKSKTRYVIGTYAADRQDGRNLMLDLLDV